MRVKYICLIDQCNNLACALLVERRYVLVQTALVPADARGLGYRSIRRIYDKRKFKNCSLYNCIH